MFDPYRKWLGIPVKDQPPNYYRLLSLERFEEDLEVIEGAVDRTMGFIRQYQSGEHATEAANLLNEIARARICLLKPATKSEYDAKLKLEIEKGLLAAADQTAPETDLAEVEFQEAPRRTVASRRKKSKKSNSLAWPWIIGGVGAALVTVAAVTISKPDARMSHVVSEISTTLPDATPAKPTIPVNQAPRVSDARPDTTKIKPILSEAAPAEKGKPAPLIVARAADPTRKPLGFEKPGFDEWARSVADAPDKWRETVFAKFKELNPEFEGPFQLNPPLNGSVSQWKISTDHITDISPVRVLKGLNILHCMGSISQSGEIKGQLSDLSPLSGLKLERLFCGRSKNLRDLSPLQGIPLTEIDFESTPVSDLRPLHRMKLRYVVCSSTQVSDLTPLMGMPLDILHCENTGVADLSPLQGMELTVLNILNTNVTDLSPLQGMKLRILSFSPHKIIKGMDIIRGMKSLRTIRASSADLPPADFWKKYEAGEFEKPSP